MQKFFLPQHFVNRDTRSTCNMDKLKDLSMRHNDENYSNNYSRTSHNISLSEQLRLGIQSHGTKHYNTNQARDCNIPREYII